MNEPEADATATTAAALRAVATTAAFVADAAVLPSEGWLYKLAAGVPLPAFVVAAAAPGFALRLAWPAALRTSGQPLHFLS